jgi:hypothetical protein
MRLYLSVVDFLASPLGSYWASRAQPPQLAHALSRASRKADSLCGGRRLGLQGATTLTQAALAAGRTLQVASVIGFDAGAEDVVLLGTERLAVTGVAAASYGTGAYPGTITLATPLAGTYSAGTTVQAALVERRTVRGGAYDKDESAYLLSQQAQMALAHAPEDDVSDLVPRVFLSSPPVVRILTMEVILRYGTAPVLLNAPPSISPELGIYRFPIGTYVPQGSEVQTTYCGGYGTVPDDVAEAVELLAADSLARANPLRAQGFGSARTADEAVSYGALVGGRSVAAQEAAALLAPYLRPF